jgi:D-alanyl-D-alanine dipeptidase
MKFYKMFILFNLFIRVLCSCAQQKPFNSVNKSEKPIIQNLVGEYIKEVENDSAYAMLELKKIIPELVYDLRYASTNNFTGRNMYPKDLNIAFLRKMPALALRSVQEELAKEGLGLKIFDAYRPYAVTCRFWKLIKDERYVANPSKGSGHNRGLAVDLTIIDARTEEETDMGTGFDHFSDTAHHSFINLPEQILKNREKLKTIMQKNWFKALETEWWHYSWPNDKNYMIIDIPFKKLLTVNSK